MVSLSLSLFLLERSLTFIEPMQGMSEDEGGDEEPEVQVDTAKIEAAKKARDERAENLRKMMEDDGKPEAASYDLNLR